MEINCKQYNTKVLCDTRNANCKWLGKRGCTRRPGVIAGARFRYNQNGNVVEIDENEPPTTQLQALNVQDPFEMVYDPENDPQRPVLTQKSLFSGTFGMTFIPAFPCTTGQRFLNTLGKVFWDTDSADNEWEMSKVLQNLEKGTSQKYFTYPKFQCEINFRCPENGTPLNRLTSPEKDLYNYYKKQTNDRPSNTLVQHVMEYSGFELNAYFRKYHDNIKQLSRAEFMTILENLFYGVKRLNENGLIHCDLKEANIIISNTKRLRIIDFGLMVNFSDFYNPNVNTLLMEIYQYVSAPELDAFVRKQRNLPQLTYQEHLKFIDKHTFNGVQWYNYFIGDQAANEQKFNDTISSIQSGGLTYLTSVDAAAKQDPYSIGLITLRLLDKFAITIPSAQDDQDSVKHYRQLMKGLLDPNPRTRFTIKQAITELKEITKHPHRDPFRIHQDPPEMTTIFSAFGKNPRFVRGLSSVNSDIKYLLK